MFLWTNYFHWHRGNIQTNQLIFVRNERASIICINIVMIFGTTSCLLSVTALKHDDLNKSGQRGLCEGLWLEQISAHYETKNKKGSVHVCVFSFVSYSRMSVKFIINIQWHNQTISCSWYCTFWAEHSLCFVCKSFMILSSGGGAPVWWCHSCSSFLIGWNSLHPLLPHVWGMWISQSN